MGQGVINQDSEQVANNQNIGYTTSETEIKYRTINNGNPIRHDDVDANFEILRKGINQIVTDIDGVVDRDVTTDLSGAQLGFTEGNRDYPVELGKNTEELADTRLFVNVPWTDTLYTASGTGLTLSGTTFSHANTSTQASSENSGRTYIQDITLDGFGHVTGLATATETVTDTTYTSGTGLSLSGTIFSHADTSTQSSSNNSGRTYIQDITLDSFGHVTGLATATETVVNTNTTYTAGSGLSLNGTTFSNSAPDQTVSLTGSGATSVTGTYPNFTISSTDTNTDTNTTYTAGDGLSLSGTTFSNSAPDKTVSLTGSGSTSVTGTYPNFTISSTDTNTNTVTKVGTSASNGSTGNVVLSGGGSTSVSKSGTTITISSTDTNTTYSNATTSASGLMSSTDKGKLNNIDSNANNYSHPTGDGNKHVPATGTTSSGKVLTAGATAGSFSWQTAPGQSVTEGTWSTLNINLNVSGLLRSTSVDSDLVKYTDVYYHRYGRWAVLSGNITFEKSSTKWIKTNYQNISSDRNYTYITFDNPLDILASDGTSTAKIYPIGITGTGSQNTDKKKTCGHGYAEWYGSTTNTSTGGPMHFVGNIKNFHDPGQSVFTLSHDKTKISLIGAPHEWYIRGVVFEYAFIIDPAFL